MAHTLNPSTKRPRQAPYATVLLGSHCWSEAPRPEQCGAEKLYLVHTSTALFIAEGRQDTHIHIPEAGADAEAQAGVLLWLAPHVSPSLHSTQTRKPWDSITHNGLGLPPSGIS